MSSYKEIPVSELELGDVIVTHDFPFNFCTVIKKTEEQIECIRPYVVVSNFSMADRIGSDSGLGVIPYIGMENLVLQRAYSHPVLLVRKNFEPIN